jgi:Fe-S-cluster containining protein
VEELSPWSCAVDLNRGRDRLMEIYSSFDVESAPFRSGAVCEPGCADCCTNVGDVDITTLEGIFIQDAIRRLPAALQKDLRRRIKENRKVRGRSRLARCGFLLPDNLCVIYESRPFSCRRLYSVKRCGETGPTVHRRVWDLAEKTVERLQELDDTGCSGHLSHVLSLLNDAKFMKTYLDGGFAPAEAGDLIQNHGLTINRYAKPSAAVRQ